MLDGMDDQQQMQAQGSFEGFGFIGGEPPQDGGGFAQVAEGADMGAAPVEGGMGYMEPMNFVNAGGADFVAPPADAGMGYMEPMNFVNTGSPTGELSPAVPAQQYVDPFQGMPVKDAASMGSKTIPEMSILREWEDKHERDLEEVGRKEANDKEARRKEAEDELKAFFEERSTNIQKRHVTNRADEDTFQETCKEAAQPGFNTWQRVMELVDVNARTAEDSRDTSRMRNLLIQLKASPPVSASAATPIAA